MQQNLSVWEESMSCREWFLNVINYINVISLQPLRQRRVCLAEM